MKRKRWIAATAVMTVLLLCMGTVTAGAASLSDIKSEIKQKEAELKEGQSKESSLSDQMVQLEEKIYSMQASIDRLDAAIEEGEAKLAVLEEELKEAEEKVGTQNDNLGQRLRNMYKSGSVGFLDVLLDSGSFSEFLTNLDMVEKVYTSDKEVLSGLEDAYNEIDAKKKEVEALQKEMNDSRAVAQEEKANLEESKAQVEQQKQQIAASNEETEKMLDSLKADAERASADAKQSGSSSSSSTYTGGAMAWPVPSVGTSMITSIYGWRTHPIFGVGRGHTGVDIAANTGSAVVAANPGTVIRSSWYGDYGNCVMIDHGGGVVTLYGHNSKLLVKVGQKVSRGQTIALVGSTGWSTGPHCHFEVMINGSHTDPLDYIL